jgi:hypothetical protein
VHYNLEGQSNLAGLVEEILERKENIVITWGFAPNDPPSVNYVQRFNNAGFKLVWFDGNRPAALREFLERESRKPQSVPKIPEICFYAQMFNIEQTNIVKRLNPTIINPFDERGKFKETGALLEEIKEKTL